MVELKERETQKNFCESNMERLATQLLWEMGIQAKLKGYACLRSAIVLSVLHPELCCKQLYDMIAKQYHRKPTKVWKL